MALILNFFFDMLPHSGSGTTLCLGVMMCTASAGGHSMDAIPDMMIKLILSAFLGGLIGLEREMHARAAGLRTHILVATGSTLIMMVSNYMFALYEEQTASSIVRLDPARIAAMTITGIGFLGAGTIIQSKEIVRGLTTAACLWVIAAVGLAVGCGFFLPAIEQVLRAHQIHILKVGLDKNLTQQEITYDIEVRMKKDIRDFIIVNELATIAGLKRVQWI